MNTYTPAPTGKLNKHDLKVLLFHAVIIFIQGGLISLGKEDFGEATPTVALYIQLGAEFLRRLIV